MLGGVSRHTRRHQQPLCRGPHWVRENHTSPLGLPLPQDGPRRPKKAPRGRRRPKMAQEGSKRTFKVARWPPRWPMLLQDGSR
eukprot:8569905-Pyramimonas_sp.AAC.1